MRGREEKARARTLEYQVGRWRWLRLAMPVPGGASTRVIHVEAESR